jgi:O-antigen ligase
MQQALQPSRPFHFLIFLGAVALGIILGLLTSYLPIALYGSLAGVLALILAYLMIRYPQFTVSAFFLAYTIQGTLLFGLEIRGLYYPIYALMAFNMIMGLATGRTKGSLSLLLPYLAFYVLVLFSLFNLATGLNFELFQKLFIYSLGLFTFFQFRSEDTFRLLLRFQSWAGIVVAIWVIITALQGEFGDRVAIQADQNNVSTMISFGMIPILAHLLTQRLSWFQRVVTWSLLAVGAYALLLLASRGITIALGMALIFMIARVFTDPRRAIPILFLGVVASIIVAGLPGSDMLVDRFNQGDVTSANGRLPLWQAGIQEVMSSSPLQLLFGHGMNYSLQVTSRVVGKLYSMHNTYLQMLLEFGILGLSLFVGLHIAVLRVLWSDRQPLALYATSMIIFLLFAHLSVTIADDFLSWVVLGTALAIVFHRQQAKSEPMPLLL